MRTFRRVIATVAFVMLTTLYVATPSLAETATRYAAGEWLARDWAGATPGPAARSAVAEGVESVDLVRTDPGVGTSFENADLNLPVVAGDRLEMEFLLSDLRNGDNDAVRMFAYDAPGVDTAGRVPTFGPYLASTWTGTAVLEFTRDATIGAFGIAYDSRNATTGKVTFGALRLVHGEAVTYISLHANPAPAVSASPTPSAPTEVPVTAAAPATVEAPNLPVAAAILAGIIVVVVVAGSITLVAMRRRGIA